ncbi:hypothetical protein [Leptospira licerasiae]|uniref:Uncharacterized protein n=1 Tax=Leptospira licerasiae str. MMD4847 TaxID=1049971 RepID=A0ABN0HBH4_9LEPT|nr:hypothetical protein [Leptospira licerasiae]EIE03221.1 hypothetical protein LEP1GSC185_0960 [Leptospira licerasiae serovar Varillal str. VAR 010]EJZ43088.1 hypothetical protein LEP1GSC178_3584 [Leptospira licerasiae str. MMD4847]
MKEKHPLKFRKALIHSGLSETEFRVYWNRVHDLQKDKLSAKELALLITIEVEMRPASMDPNPAAQYKKNEMLPDKEKRFFEAIV